MHLHLVHHRPFLFPRCARNRFSLPAFPRKMHFPQDLSALGRIFGSSFEWGRDLPTRVIKTRSEANCRATNEVRDFRWAATATIEEPRRVHLTEIASLLTSSSSFFSSFYYSFFNLFHCPFFLVLSSRSASSLQPERYLTTSYLHACTHTHVGVVCLEKGTVILD